MSSFEPQPHEAGGTDDTQAHTQGRHRGLRPDKGDKGDPGPSEAFTGFAGTRPVISDNARRVMVDLVLPPGNYAVTGTVSLFDSDRSARYHCELMSGPARQDLQDGSFGEDELSIVTLLGTFAFPNGGTVAVECSTTTAGVQSAKGRILAVRVGRVPI